MAQSELSNSQKLEYNSHILKAKEMVDKAEHYVALEHYRRAYQLHPSDKLDAKISKLMKSLNLDTSLMETKRSCPFTPDRQDLKRRSPLSNQDFLSTKMAVEEEENKENTMPAVDVPSVAPQDDLSTLMAKAKEFIAEQDVESALRCYEKAYSIEPSEKIARRLERMRAYLETEPEAKPGEEKLEMHTAPPRPRDTIASRTTASPASSMGGVLPSLNSDIGMSDEDVAIYNSLISQAKNVLRCGDFEEALGLYEKAHMLHPSDKLASKIAKLKSVSSQLSPETEVTGTSTSPNPAKVVEAAIDAHYSELTAKARKLIEQEKLEEALVLFKDAYGVKPSDKLERRIQRIEQYLQQQTQTNQGVSQTAPDEPESADLYNQLITKGKEFISQNKVAEALKMYQEAAEIRPSEKLSNRITKCQDYLSQCGDEDGDFTHVGNGFYLHQDLYTKLYPHQKEGLLWFWGLHKKRTGGILADDMGLGKTIQVISFLSGLFDAEELKTVIIVMPLSLIENWKREFEKWAPGILLQTYHGGSLRERARSVAKVQRRGGVLLTSYGMIVSAAELLAKKDGESFGRDFSYDYVILDEGHKIKNPTKTSKGVHMIAAKHRIILTGTPIQNNLKEMWALFDWTHHGMLLGTARTFHSEYSKPITRAREKCATYGERRLGEQMAESLKKIISPYLLRRTKAEVKAASRARGEDGTVVVGPEMPKMTRKNDFVVWCYLSEMQMDIYRSFSEQDEIKELLNTARSPLTALVVLKKICDHPRLLSNNQCHKLGLFTPQELVGADTSALKDCAANQIKSVSDSILMEESGKLKFLVQLMSKLKAEGHRTLIFSLSRKMLDIIQKVLSNRGHNIMRMDGTITDLSEREKCVSSFQNSTVYDTFLLTTQVGGVGLTLTAADRVVIFDPSWNPATDSQAVDRAFRIGQQKNVCIYRFISCGTVEEKIYRRQIFKDSVNRQTMQKDEKNVFRYFSNHELYELFQLDNTRESKTQQQLEQMHAHQRVTDTALDEHIAYLYSCEMYGLSDHDLMFSKEDEEMEGDENTEYLNARVMKAVELLNKEAQLQSKMNEEEGKYVPGHLASLPKPSAKHTPTFDSSQEDNSPSTDRLVSEYVYNADAGSQSAAASAYQNDWRSQLDDADDEVTTSSPSKPRQSSPVVSNTSAHYVSADVLEGSSDRFQDSHASAADGNLSANDSAVSINDALDHTSVANNSVFDGSVVVSEDEAPNEIADESIGANQVADESMGANEVTDESAGANAVADESVEANELADESMQANDVADKSVAANEVANESGRANEIADKSIEANKVADESMAANEVADDSAGANAVADDSVGANKVADDSVAANEVEDQSILANESIHEIEWSENDDILVDESQNESMLGDDFGNLHADYTVRDSEDEVSFSSPAMKRRSRRSTFLMPVPQSDEEGEINDEQEINADHSDDELTDYSDLY